MTGDRGWVSDIMSHVTGGQGGVSDVTHHVTGAEFLLYTVCDQEAGGGLWCHMSCDWGQGGVCDVLHHVTKGQGQGL